MIPESNILSSVFIPKYFKSSIVSKNDGTLIEDEDFNFETDRLGLKSIIKLNKIPYFELSMWDHQRRSWYHTDKFGNRWRKYNSSEWIIEENKKAGFSPWYISKSGMFDGKAFPVFDVANNNYSWQYEEMQNLDIILDIFRPIDITINNESLVDITNYSGASTVIPKLNLSNPIDNPQFYYDNKSRIYSNKDFGSYSIDDINISYNIVIDNVNVKAKLATNSTQYVNNTPLVDYFIIKLIGQTL